MKFNYRLLVGAAALIALAGACSKKYKQPDTVEPNVVNPFGGPPGSLTPGSQLNKLFKDLRSVPERQCVTAGVAQTVTFKKGTKLTFYPNSFKDAAGKIIANGTVCLEVIEMYKPGEMIANRATTTSGEVMLQSGGQVYINATMDGQKVYANKYGIAFKQPAASIQPMALYFGNTNNSDSVATWDTGSTAMGMIVTGTVTDTVDTSDTSGSGGGGAGSFTPVYYYQFDTCISFNWINCDYPWNKYPRTNVNIKCTDTGFSYNNTQAFLVFPEINGVMKLRFSFTSNGMSTSTHSIPTGVKGHLIIAACKYDRYYYSEIRDFTVTENIELNTTLQHKSLGYIQSKLGEF